MGAAAAEVVAVESWDPYSVRQRRERQVPYGSIDAHRILLSCSVCEARSTGRVWLFGRGRPPLQADRSLLKKRERRSMWLTAGVFQFRMDILRGTPRCRRVWKCQNDQT
jgi:hypothetical protein